MISVSDLTTPLTQAQVMTTWINALQTLGIPANSWKQGGVARTILAVLATTYAGFTQVLASFVAAGFLETATGDWLTVLARNVYGVQRIVATFATGFVTLTNTGGGLYDFNAGDVTVQNPTTQKTYTLAAFVLNPGDTITVACTATELGTASNSAPATITFLVTTMLGVTVSNALAVAGTDDQADADLRTLCLNRLAALSPLGPAGAYAYAVSVAKRADGVTPVNVNRIQVSPWSSTAQVQVWVAAPSGAPSSDDVASCQASVVAIAEPDTVTASTSAASVVPVTASLVVWAQAAPGVLASDVQTLVTSALTTYFSSFPIGGLKKPPSTQGYLYASALEGVAKGAYAGIFAVDGVANDIALADGEVAALAATVDVRLVA